MHKLITNGHVVSMCQIMSIVSMLSVPSIFFRPKENRVIDAQLL